jgi:hypothetical protein
MVDLSDRAAGPLLFRGMPCTPAPEFGEVGVGLPGERGLDCATADSVPAVSNAIATKKSRCTACLPSRCSSRCAGGSLVAGAIAGAIGAAIGTLGGHAARARLAATIGKDRPAAFIEDVIAIVRRTADRGAGAMSCP